MSRMDWRKSTVVKNYTWSRADWSRRIRIGDGINTFWNGYFVDGKGLFYGRNIELVIVIFWGSLWCVNCKMWNTFRLWDLWSLKRAPHEPFQECVHSDLVSQIRCAYFTKWTIVKIDAYMAGKCIFWAENLCLASAKSLSGTVAVNFVYLPTLIFYKIIKTPQK